MQFSNRSSSSFGTDSDIEDGDQNRLILGKSNRKVSVPTKAALSIDKTVHKGNVT